MAFNETESWLITATVFIVLGVYIWHASRASTSTSEQNSDLKASPKPGHSDVLSATERTPGEWTPVEFQYPTVQPCEQDLANIRPIPYRPFKWGKYHVTMGIRTMPWDEWIELDEEYFQYHAIREERIRTRRSQLVKTQPAIPGLVDSGHAAAFELLQELCEYLSVRFPKMFTIERLDSEKAQAGWNGQGTVKAITIVPLQKRYELEGEDPLVIASLLVQEDLAIMLESTDGQYRLQAGAILVAGSWRLQDKIGMTLDDIHVSGDVPQFKSKLQLSMNRYFSRLPVDKPIVRNNYALQTVAPQHEVSNTLDPNELAWAHTMKGSEDVEEGFMTGQLRSVTGSETPQTASFDPANIRLRVERQTLRRLPKTGAIVFTVRVYLTPLEKLAHEPGVPGRLASAIRGWPEDVEEYKAAAEFKDVLPYLDEQHAAQVAQGLVDDVKKG